jgi:hypothetical protein
VACERSNKYKHPSKPEDKYTLLQKGHHSWFITFPSQPVNFVTIRQWWGLSEWPWVVLDEMVTITYYLDKTWLTRNIAQNELYHRTSIKRLEKGGHYMVRIIYEWWWNFCWQMFLNFTYVHFYSKDVISILWKDEMFIWHLNFFPLLEPLTSYDTRLVQKNSWHMLALTVS